VTQETEMLLREVLIELLKLLRHINQTREQESFESELRETLTRRWGYPQRRRRDRK
jgi:hypothetical protein